MPKLNWFPGHMAKALKQMSEEIKKVDMLIYVLDARAPFSCLNPSFTSLAINKPVLYVLNKCDLADDDITKKFKNKQLIIPTVQEIAPATLDADLDSKIRELESKKNDNN